MSERRPSPPGSDETGADRLLHLRTLVQDYEVCWETRPQYAVVGEGLRTIGFSVELSAAHHQPHHEPVAGCPECLPPLRALEEIVDFILPTEPRDSIYDVHVKWGAMQYSRRRANRPEVGATIDVLHATGADRPIDACEERCLADIVSRLKAIGAQEGSWTGHRA